MQTQPQMQSIIAAEKRQPASPLPPNTEVFLGRDEMKPGEIYIAEKYHPQSRLWVQRFEGKFCKQTTEQPPMEVLRRGNIKGDRYAIFKILNENNRPEIKYFTPYQIRTGGYKFYTLGKGLGFINNKFVDGFDLTTLPKALGPGVIKHIEGYDCGDDIGGSNRRRSRRKTKRYNSARKRKSTRKRKSRKSKRKIKSKRRR